MVQEQKKNVAGVFLLGFVGGVLIICISMYLVMPKMMIVTKESGYDYNTTVSKIEAAISAAGWKHKGTTNISKAIKDETGNDIGVNIGIIKLCKGSYAEAILKQEDSRYVSCLMPCGISVWEGDDGRVYVSKMNTGLMGTMFGGIISEVMGGKVGPEEEVILKDIFK